MFGGMNAKAMAGSLNLQRQRLALYDSMNKPVATDPYFSSVVLLMHGDGSNGSSVFTDSSSHAHAVTAIGTPTISSANAPFDGGSIHFPTGNASGLRVGNSTDWAFGTGDFTIEARLFNVTASNYNIIAASWDATGGTGWFFAVDSASRLNFWFNGANFSNLAGSVPLNAWSTLAVSKVSGTIQLYINGAQVISLAGQTAAMTSSTNGIGIGVQSDGSANKTSECYLEELRITKGVGRYGGGSYTPATTAFPNQ